MGFFVGVFCVVVYFVLFLRVVRGKGVRLEVFCGYLCVVCWCVFCVFFVFVY